MSPLPLREVSTRDERYLPSSALPCKWGKLRNSCPQRPYFWKPSGPFRQSKHHALQADTRHENAWMILVDACAPVFTGMTTIVQFRRSRGGGGGNPEVYLRVKNTSSEVSKYRLHLISFKPLIL